MKHSACAFAAAALTAALLLAACDKPAGPARQVAKIALLPDTPPPPPPPPKEEPKPKPIDENKPRPMEPARQIEAPPAPPQPLKMEGAAGDGPSNFAAGSVGKDYAGGEPVIGGGGGAAAAGPDRAQERLFANSARQLLRDEIERHLKSEASQLTAVFSVWFEADGSIRRFELASTGDSAADTELNAALAGASRDFRLQPPAGLSQPLRFKLSLRPLG